LRELLVHSARAFIYTTAPPPAQLGAALGALDLLESDPECGARLLTAAAGFRRRLQEEGLDTLGSASQIVPVRVGDNHAALRAAQRLREKRIHTVAIRPPTVPAGTARLRFSVTLAHEPDALEHAARVIAKILHDEAGAAQ
jgi:glycine C-acetyltransferase/8-amino-7-oxononanoate synthase